MTIHHQTETVTLHHGDCLDVLRELPDASVDSVVTDPPYGLEFMGKEWDKFGATVETAVEGQDKSHPFRDGTQRVRFGNGRAATAAFGDWCELWATECLRVLKPGGHMLAFGGTRTWHRLACAVEDAGFEVRDSLAWLYGQGFPKSLDVSKAIDKRAEENSETKRRIALVAEVIRSHREAKGMERSSVSLAVVGTPSGACWNWEHQQLPSAEMWPTIKRVLDIPNDFDGLIEGDRAQFIAAEREVIRARTRPATGRAEHGSGGYAFGENFDDTAPATPEAEQWSGWGTALKPAHEPVVVARKPHSLRDILATIGSHLDRLEDAWQAQEVDPITPTGAEVGSSGQMVTSPSESMEPTSSSTVTSWKACWAELCELTSTSTTATTSETTTALKTLSSSLSKLTGENMPASETSPHGPTSLATAVDNLFASVVCGLRATLALSATELATESTPHSPPDAEGSSTAFEPIVVARKPLVGTVAENVLTHGTGALNIDACRIGHTSEADLATSLSKNPGRADTVQSDVYGSGRPQQSVNESGRWPANVVLDEHQAEQLDHQSGVTATQATRANPARQSSGGMFGLTSGGDRGNPGAGEVGGASRFFYVAKANQRERPREDGVAHPTVKPLELMRWLVRLVTPPGGTVLEPFAGSGTTVAACIVEGFSCIAIEREADYLPLILQRIAQPLPPEPFKVEPIPADQGSIFEAFS